jgi:hypothetical protein
MEERFGKVSRVWVMDRGMVNAENIALLNATGRRYVLGTARSELGRFAQQMLIKPIGARSAKILKSKSVRPDGSETFLLCRSVTEAKKRGRSMNGSPSASKKDYSRWVGESRKPNGFGPRPARTPDRAAVGTKLSRGGALFDCADRR